MVWRDDRHSEMILNPLPRAVVILAVPLVLIELVLSLLDNGVIGGPEGARWRMQLITDHAIWPALWQQEEGARLANPGLMLRFVSYSFLHADWQHLMFAGVILLAIGKFVGDRFSTLGLLAVFFVSAAFGALCYLLSNASPAMLIGCYPGVYGLIGALTYIYWQEESALPFNRRIKAFRLIGLLVGFQIIFAFALGAGLAAMISELSAFACGFALSFLVSPGSARRLLRQIRQR